MTTPAPVDITEVVLAEPGEFPDDELLVRLYLGEIVQLASLPVVVTDEPRNPVDPPVVTALRLTGQGVPRAKPWEATRRLEVATIGETRAESRELTRQVENAMLALGGATYRGVLVDRVTQANGPAQVPYAPDVRRMPSTWDLTFRRHAAIAARATVLVGPDGRPVEP